MRWVTLEHVLSLHSLVLRETGGAAGILSFERLESAMSRPFAAFEGQEMFPDLWSKVAALVHGIVSSHPFVDGNKRTAFVAADVCLKVNGFRLAPSDVAEAFFWSIARGEQTVEAIAEWLASHAQEEGAKE